MVLIERQLVTPRAQRADSAKHLIMSRMSHNKSHWGQRVYAAETRKLLKLQYPGTHEVKK